MWFSYQLDERICVTVTKKRMRTLRLRVKPSGEVACSVPLLTTKKTAIDFITSRTAWIQHAVARTATRTAPQALRADSAAALAGCTQDDCTGSYSPAWKTAALKNFIDSAERHLTCFAAQPIPQFSPERIKGRAMKTLWGSCNRRTNTITLNWQLFALPQICIDYVMLHELTHFLYLHHDRAFYAFIAEHMPDYKARVRLLRSVQQG